MSIWITGSSCEEVLTLIFKTENNNQFLVSLTLNRISVTLNSKSSFFTIYQSCLPLPPPYWQSIPSLEGFCPANPQHPGNQGQGNSMRAKGSSALRRSSCRLGPQWFSALNFTLWFQGSEDWRHFLCTPPRRATPGLSILGSSFSETTQVKQGVMLVLIVNLTQPKIMWEGSLTERLSTSGWPVGMSEGIVWSWSALIDVGDAFCFWPR